MPPGVYSSISNPKLEAQHENRQTINHRCILTGMFGKIVTLHAIPKPEAPNPVTVQQCTVPEPPNLKCAKDAPSNYSKYSTKSTSLPEALATNRSMLIDLFHKLLSMQESVFEGSYRKSKP